MLINTSDSLLKCLMNGMINKYKLCNDLWLADKYVDPLHHDDFMPTKCDSKYNALFYFSFSFSHQIVSSDDVLKLQKLWSLLHQVMACQQLRRFTVIFHKLSLNSFLQKLCLTFVPVSHKYRAVRDVTSGMLHVVIRPSAHASRPSVFLASI